MRRRVRWAMIAALVVPAAPAWSQTAGPLEREMERVAKVAGGRSGACAIHLESGRKSCFNAGWRFPMASTFKVPVAVELLSRVDAGKLDLARMVDIQDGDLHPGSGTLTYEFNHPGVSLSVRNLLELMLRISDNSAADLLLRLAGGADGVNARMRQLGVEGIQVDRPTNQLIEDFRAEPRRFPLDLRDTATPEGMTQLLVKIWRKEALKPETTELLLDIMRRCETGAARIKGLLPAGTEVAHKTGTMGGTVNDVGIVTLPDGTHAAMAVFVAASEAPEADRERGIAEVARAVHDYFLFVR